jgi:DNA-binding transcriptional ArsR family regulator
VTCCAWTCRRPRRFGCHGPRDAALIGAAGAAKALADSTRLTVAAALRDGGELCVCDLAWVTERSDKLVSHHVRRLRAAGLVRSRREGKMVMYELTEVGAALLRAVLPVAEHVGADA